MSWRGTSGADYWQGEVGERLFGLKGNDSLFGSYIMAGEGEDRLFGYGTDDFLFGEAGEDYIWGNKGDDLLNGNGGNDTLAGGEGNDLIVGGNQNDLLMAGAGNDTLYGGNGNDTLASGTTTGEKAERDLLVGGNGADVFDLTEGISSYLDRGSTETPALAIIKDFNPVEGDNVQLFSRMVGSEVDYRVITQGSDSVIEAQIGSQEIPLAVLEDIIFA